MVLSSSLTELKKKKSKTYNFTDKTFWQKIGLGSEFFFSFGGFFFFREGAVLGVGGWGGKSSWVKFFWYKQRICVFISNS